MISDPHPRLTQLLRDQTSLANALGPLVLWIGLLCVWFVCGLASLALAHIEPMLSSGLLKVGLAVGPVTIPGLVLLGFVRRHGNQKSAREVEALLARPDQLSAITVTSTQHRSAVRHWLKVVARDGARAEIMFYADPEGMRAELARAFPKVTAGAAAVAPAAPASAMRHPRELVLVDAQRNAIEASVVVVGGGAKRFARTLLTSTGGSVDGVERSGELEHFTMALGPIRGWSIRLFVYAVDGSLESATRTAPDLVGAASATVLVQSSPEATRLDPVLFPIAKIAGAGRGVLAFVGARPALDELIGGGGPAPVIVSHAGDRGAADVLKQITGRILASLRAAA